MKNLLLISLLLLAGCSVPATNAVLSEVTRQDVERAFDLRLGLTEDAVIKTMGRPVFKELEGNKSALQWCSTNDPIDSSGRPNGGRYVVAFFFEGNLVATRNYNIPNTHYADCKLRFNQVNWTYQPATKVFEYRFR